MDSPQQSPQSQERLIGDLRLVIENAEELLKNTDQYTSALYQNARAKLTQALSAATEELERFEDAKLARMIEACQVSEPACGLSGEQRVLHAFK
ncbi:MAG: DUF883 domain-containing protein [Pseudomonadota bacterium]